MTTSQISVSRRSLLGAAAGAGALAAAGGVTFLSAPAEAAVDQVGKPMAGALRYKVGDLEITALLDGYLDVTPELVIGYDASEGQRLRDAAQGPVVEEAPDSSKQRATVEELKAKLNL